MTSPSKSTSFEARLFRIKLVRRFDTWLHVMPHPAVAVEITPNRIAAVRSGARGQLDSVAVTPLPAGALTPSPVEPNVVQPESLRTAFKTVLKAVPDHGAPIALFVPDPVVRMFILPFENLTRREQDALPLLRWRLKKSVPFDVDEAAISWTRQGGRDGNLEVVTAVARQRIIREYEQIAESAGAPVSVVASSTLATLPLLEETGATLLVRIGGRTLTTVIVNGSKLCVYRATEMPADADALEPQAVLDEVFPAIAFFQDNCGASLDRARIAGFGAREAAFGGALAAELKVPVDPLSHAAGAQGLETHARELIDQGLDALVGWITNA